MKRMITENRLRKIISETVRKVLNEDLNGIMVTYNSPTKGRNQLMASSLEDAKRMIPDDATYFDITKGSNSSEEDNLISWGGKNGYWDNKTNPNFPYGEKLKPREMNSAMRKRKF